MTIKITKQLATMEDLAIGTGTVVQERNGVPLTLTKIDFNSRVIRVTSIAAIKAYSVPAGYVFSLNAGGRSGTFDVVAGNFSVALAADNFNGVYVGLADNPTATTKVAKRRLGDYVRPEWFGALSDGTDAGPSIQAAVDYVYRTGGSRRGGTLLFSAAYNTSQSIFQKDRVCFIGTGSRSAGISWLGADLTDYEKGVVYCVAGTDASPDFVFSTNIFNMYINGSGITDVSLAIRGHQENCTIDSCVLSGFKVAGLEALPFSSVNHAITFSNLHIIPASGETGAYGMKMSHTQKCEFSNITTDIGNPQYYARGIYLYNNPLLNVLSAIHTEDCLYGIYQESGANNIYQGLEARNGAGNGIAHFFTTSSRYQINAIRTISGFTKQLDDGTNVINAGTDTDSINIIRGANYFRRRADGLTGKETLSGFLTRGVYSNAATTGVGQTYLRTNSYLAASQTKHAVIDLGDQATGNFAGKISLFGIGNQRYVTEVFFSGTVNGSGAVGNASVGTKMDSGSSPTGIEAPIALASPEAGKIRIPLVNFSATFPQVIEISLEISRSGGQAVSMEVV